MMFSLFIEIILIISIDLLTKEVLINNEAFHQISKDENHLYIIS
jgi:hypothetical protein